MYLCYIDESGTSDVPGNTSHYVLAGVSLPLRLWKACDSAIADIKSKYGLRDAEIHTAWIARSYLEQSKVANFEKLGHAERLHKTTAYRTGELLRLQRAKKQNLYRQTKKNYRLTQPYLHLTHKERLQFLDEIASCVSGWGYVRLFAECIDKVHFDPIKTKRLVDEQAFEQVVTRVEIFLNHIQGADVTESSHALLIHDNNPTFARKHTEMMKKFHDEGTLWTRVQHIVETPLFVDSQLTSMVQIADFCAYALKQYVEKNDARYFDPVFKRADRQGGKSVGVRHFTDLKCKCQICASHR